MMIELIGDFQIKVLRVVHTLGEDAYGMRIRGVLEEQLGKEVHMPQVYAALSRLESLGLLKSHLDDENSAGRRGRTRRVYSLSAHGLQRLSDGVRNSPGTGPKDPIFNGDIATATTA